MSVSVEHHQRMMTCLEAKIVALQGEVAALKEENAALEQTIDALSDQVDKMEVEIANSPTDNESPWDQAEREWLHDRL